MKNPILIPELRDLLKKRRFSALRSFLTESHALEIADFLSMLNPDEIWKLLSLVDVYRRVAIFRYFDIEDQVKLVSGSMRKVVSELLMELSPDDRADLFLHLDNPVVDRLLVLLPVSERTDVIKLTSYVEETAGAVMTTDFATLRNDDTVEKAIRKIRKEAPSKETIYYIYVTDNDEKLIGLVSLRKLIVARANQKICNLMATDMIFANVFDDQEIVAGLIEEYDLLAIPIVDSEERLVGIVTYDDAIDVIREEHTEDMEKLMAISGGVEDKSYLELSVITHFRKRAFWVVTLGIFGLLTGLIVQSFQSTLEKLIILTFYLPMLNAAGGNTGSQSATVVLRSLTLGELSARDVLKVIKKEFIISSLLSFALGVITFGRVFFLSNATTVPNDFTLINIALVISISLALQVVWSTVLGAIVPIGATKLKLDPAVVSSPLLTTFVDMGGILIYFSVARIILGI